MRLALKLFRGEPAISRFVWNFSAIHKSSPTISTGVGSALHKLYLCFSLLMDRSSGFGSTSCYFPALFRLAFASAPRLYRLTSQHNVTRRPVLQKVRHHTRVVLCLLVSIRFQVLFHSPPGVLFTFPSRYYSLSVTWSYLALGDGPPVFRRNSSCSGVLRIPLPSA